MCNGEECEAKNTCYRFTAKPNEFWQSYFTFTPIKNDKCKYYINHNKI